MRREILPMMFLIASCGSCDKGSTPNPDVGNDIASDVASDTTNTTDASIDLTADMSDMAPSCIQTLTPDDRAGDPAIFTPRWAFLPWISKDISDGPDTYAFVDGFIQRDIPVGVVVLDSPWETHYNTFVPNPERYPEFEQMVGDLRDRDVRIVLWVTQLVNERSFDLEDGGDTYEGESPNYGPGLACNYYVNDGANYIWWKGIGAGVDFFNDDARAWWHRQQDALLEMGVNGWKLDFGDSYINTDQVQTINGPVPHQTYSEEYYADFYRYGAAKVGTDEFVTMVRGYDKSYQFEGRFFARPEHAPVVWAGDNRRDWIGLADALDHVFRSAEAGYVVVGSDLGGYLNQDDKVPTDIVPFDQDNFVRWTAVAAMTPFMQLHGRANLEPWSIDVRPDETVAIYRYWAKLHTALVPFFFSLAEDAYAGGVGIVRPMGDETTWPGDYRFQVGDAFLVAPILNDTGRRDVDLPAGTWIDWWNQTETTGPTTVLDYDATDQNVMPMWIKRGALIPARPIDGELGIGTSESANELHLLAYPTTDNVATNVDIYRDDRTSYRATMTGDAAAVQIDFTTLDEVTHLRIPTSASDVSIDGTTLQGAASRAAYDANAAATWFDDGQYLYVKLPSNASPSTVAITY